MSKCVPQCCASIEIFEDQDLARSRKCAHCDGVPFISKRDPAGKTHCWTCNCQFNVQFPDYETLQLMSPAIVSCRIHPQCNWKGCFSDYGGHVQYPLTLISTAKADSQLEKTPPLDSNNTQPTLPKSKAENNQDKSTANGLLVERIEAVICLRNYMAKLKTREEHQDLANMLNELSGYSKARMAQLSDSDPAHKPLPQTSSTADKTKTAPKLKKKKKKSKVAKQNTDVLKNTTSQEQPTTTDAKDTTIQPTNEQRTQESQIQIPKPKEDQPSPSEQINEPEIKDPVNQPTHEQKSRVCQPQILKLAKPTAAQISEIMKIPYRWSDELCSEFLLKDPYWEFIHKSHRSNLSIMKQSLKNFGGRKKVTKRNNYDSIGLCLKGPEFCQSDEPRANKFGKKIWKGMHTDKNNHYADCSKVKEEQRIYHLFFAKEFFVDFDVKTRTLTVSASFNGEDSKISVVKILEEIELSKVHLYFDIYVACQKELNFHGINIEAHKKPLVSNQYHSIVKTEDKGIFCWLVDSPLIPNKKYKFQLRKWDEADIVGLGIFRKDKIAESRYQFNCTNGYQENCGMIAVDSNGNLMHDNPSMTTVDATSDFLIEHAHNVVLEYDPIEQKVSFHNLRNDKRITFAYPIDADKVNDYYVGSFMGNGDGYVYTI